MRNEHQLDRLTRARRTLAGTFAALAVASLVGSVDTAGAQSVGAAVRPALDPPVEPQVAATFRAAGFDPAAPRTLVLWRFDGTAYHRLAETPSDATGRFDFGLHPIPLLRADFGVTGASETPDASTFRRFEREVPPPRIGSEDGGGSVLHVLTAHADGELWIADADTGRLLARHPVASAPHGGSPIDLDRVLPRDRPRAIALEHVLEDGRRSAPEIWLLDEPDRREP